MRVGVGAGGTVFDEVDARDMPRWMPGEIRWTVYMNMDQAKKINEQSTWFIHSSLSFVSSCLGFSSRLCRGSYISSFPRDPTPPPKFSPIHNAR